MEQNNQPSFNVVTTNKPSKNTKQGLIIGALVVVFLAIAVVAGVILVRQQQDIREKAEAVLVCPAAEACPVAGDPTLLKSCYSADAGDPPRDISCSTIANVSATTFCGSTNFCCTSLGASWTTDLTMCSTPSPTPTLTPTPSATATATASATPTETATSSATSSATPQATGSATPAPIPVTGMSWPTIVGTAVGILVIIGSILLVL